MKTSFSTLIRLFIAVALVAGTASTARADEEFTVQVSGFSIQGPATPNVGLKAGGNYIVERGLQLAIFPCSTVWPFCPENTNGFFGKVTTAPERVERIDGGNDNWTFRMFAKQVIAAGDVDYRTDPFFSFLGVQSFPTAGIVADGVVYTNCKIYQTLVATGDLFHISPFTGQPVTLETSGAANVFATWVITRGSTCTGPSGKPVTVTGQGTLVYNPPLVNVPSYEGTLIFSRK